MSLRGKTIWIAAVVAALSTLATSLRAQQPAPDPASVLGRERLIRRFDFEEARYNNFESLPISWFAIGRPANTTDPNFMRLPLHVELIAKPEFSAYTTVAFDRPQIEPGPHSLHLGLDGGSAGAFLEVGAIPAVPGGDYLIGARVRTTPLQYARAQLVAYFVDKDGHRIEPSVASSELIQSNGRWSTVSVRLSGDYPEAAWIGIQVELLQVHQQALPDSPLGSRQVPYQDVHGGAWFDDVSVWQLPRVVLHSQSPVNVVVGPERPRLYAQASDLTGRPLRVELSLYDHQLRLLAKDQHMVGEGSPMKWQWDPPVRRFGWYLVQLSVFDPPTASPQARPIARTWATLLWLPDEQPIGTPDLKRFTVEATGVSTAELPLVDEALERLRLGSLAVNVWDPNTDGSNIEQRQEALDRVIYSITRRGGQVALSLTSLPRKLLRDAGFTSEDPISLFRQPKDTWLPYLGPVLIRHGQHVRYWLLGTSDQSQAFFIPDLPQLVGAIDADFQNLAPIPHLVLPWRMDQPRRPDVPPNVGYALEVPPSVNPEAIGAHLAEWLEPPPAQVWLRLRDLAGSGLNFQSRVEDLALCMLYAWEAGVGGLTVTHPWVRWGGQPTSLLPDAQLGVFAEVAHRIQGRKVIGRTPLAEGLVGMVFDGPSGGMLAAWNRAAAPEDATIRMYLGQNPVVVDVWGNRTTPPLVDGVHRVSLSTTPVFIEGIDTSLAMFRSSFRVEPAFLESALTQHNRVIEFTNTWPYSISGELVITEPSKWTIQPQRYTFFLNPGQKASLPVLIEFPASEMVGRKTLVARFDLMANQNTQRYQVDLSAPLTVGLKDVDFQATLALERHPDTGSIDVVVTELITNKGQQTQALYTFATMRGYPRQERIISQLFPGQSTVRRFRFANVGDQLEQIKVQVGVRESSGPAMLNQVLTLDSPSGRY